MAIHKPKLIVPIVATPELLVPHRHYEAPNDYQHHQIDLANLVQGHGCLVFDRVESAERFDAAVSAIEDQSTREAWEETRDYGRVRLCSRGDQLPRKFKSEQALASWSTWAGLACVSEKDWEELANDAEKEIGLARIPRSNSAPSPDLIEAAYTRLANLREIGALSAARALNQETVAANTKRSELRRKFYEPLLKYSVSVSIYDRYVGENILEWNEQQDRDEDGSDGLEWLLGLIHRYTVPVALEGGVSRGATVDIYTTFVHKDFGTNLAKLDSTLRSITENIWKRGKAYDDLNGLAGVRLHCVPRKDNDDEHAMPKTRVVAFGHATRAVGDFGRVRPQRPVTDPRLVSYLSLEYGLKSLSGSRVATDFQQNFFSSDRYHEKSHKTIFKSITNHSVNFIRTPPFEYTPPAPGVDANYIDRAAI